MSILQDRAKAFIIPTIAKQLGYYPYFREIETEQSTEVYVNGKKVLMFGSNNYLGLTNHPKVKEAAKKAIEKYGTGCAGSSFLNGTLTIHKELEEKLAHFVGKDESIVFSTGFQTNIGVIAAISNRHDIIFIDELDHASIIEGCRLSFARTKKYLHNDLNSLEKEISEINNCEQKIIIVDGIFSMEGNIVKLPGIVELAEKHNAVVVVDDAHGLGVLGENGRGTCAYFGLSEKVDLIVGTFSKSLASIGGFVAGEKDVINYIRHHARSLIFSASMPPASAASVLAAIDVIFSEPERIDNLWKNTNYLMNSLKQMGFDTGISETPIIPVYIRNDETTFRFTMKLMDEGIFVNPIVSPAVNPDSALIRISLMANHTIEQIDIALEKFFKVGKLMKII